MKSGRSSCIECLITANSSALAVGPADQGHRVLTADADEHEGGEENTQ